LVNDEYVIIFILSNLIRFEAMDASSKNLFLNQLITKMKQQPTTHKKRQLKVYPKFFSRVDSKNVVFPEIRLAGKWLQEMGFRAGQTVHLEYSENRIVISLAKEQ
jgi:toxic protein SymE